MACVIKTHVTVDRFGDHRLQDNAWSLGVKHDFFARTTSFYRSSSAGSVPIVSVRRATGKETREPKAHVL